MPRPRTAIIVAGLLMPGLLVTGLALPAAAEDVTTSPFTPIVQPRQFEGALATQYPLTERLEVLPAAPNDYAVWRNQLPFTSIAPILNDIADSSDRVSVQVAGRSTQNRPLYLVTVTAPETPEQTARQTQLREGIADATADPAAVRTEYKTPVWFNANIHGTEMEGTSATIERISELATSTDPAVTELLATTRLYFTVTNNPDGRTVGERNTVGALDGGIGGIDANRDAMTVATREAALLRDLGQALQPMYFGDIHGYTGVLLVEPTTAPHNDSVDYPRFIPHAFAAAEAVESAVVAADLPFQTYREPTAAAPERGITIPYRDWGVGAWDDFPPVFAPQYQALGGALVSTIELPRGSDNPSAENPTQQEAIRLNIDTAKVVMDAATTYVVDNRDALLDNQLAFYADANSGAPIVSIPADASGFPLPEGAPRDWTAFWGEDDVMSVDLPRAFVIPTGAGQRSQSDADTLIRQLDAHGVDVSMLEAAAVIDGTEYPAGSAVVDMHQSRRGVANALLADGTDVSTITDGLYDMAAWSAGRLWGATVVPVGATTDGPLPATTTDNLLPVRASAPAGEGQYSSIAVTGVAELRAVNRLLQEGVAVSLVNDVTAVVGPDAASRAAVAEVAASENVAFAAGDGALLRDADEIRPLSAPRVAYLTPGWNPEQEDRLALEKVGIMDAQRVRIDRINDGSQTIPDVDILILAGFEEPSDALRAQMASFIEGGGSVVGLGFTSAWANATLNLLPARATEGTGRSSAIVTLDTAAGSFLTPTMANAYVEPPFWFSELGAGVTVQQTYSQGDPFVSGFWRERDGQEGRTRFDAAGQPAVVEGPLSGGGRAVLFGTSPTYRASTVGGFTQLALTLLNLAPAGAAVPVPAEPEPPVEPNPSAEPQPTNPGTAPGAGPESPGAESPLTGDPGSPDAESPRTGDLARTGAPDLAGVFWAGGAAVVLGALLTAGALRRRRAESASDDREVVL